MTKLKSLAKKLYGSSSKDPLPKLESKPAPSSDLESLRSSITEQNALASIDLVYFLLVPGTTYVMSQLPYLKAPSFGVVLSLFVYPGGLFSLPLGIYAKLVDSIIWRVRAWSIYLWVSHWIFWGIGLGQLSEWLIPLEIAKQTSMGYIHVFSVVFAVGFLPFGVVMYCFREIWKIFYTRVSSRRPELSKAFDFPKLEMSFSIDMSHEFDVVLIKIGAASYIIHLVVALVILVQRTIPI